MTFWIDAVVLLVVAVAAYRGWRLGASVVAARLVGLLGGLLLGLTLAQTLLSDRLSPVTHLLLGVVVALGAAIVGAAAGAALGRRIARVFAAVHLGVLDRIAGLLLRGAVAAVLCSLALSLIVALGPATWSDAVRRSAVSVVLQPARAAVSRLAADLLSVAPGDVAALVPASTSGGTTAAQLRVVHDAAVAHVVDITAAGCADGVQGTGFVAASGVVVTNAHVVRGEHSVTVHATDGDYDATVVGYDTRADLAVLRVAGLAVSPLPLATQDAPNGTAAVVIGYPAGVLRTVRAVVLQRIPVPGTGSSDALHLAYRVRVDVHHGNSGSPLLDTHGRVIGVVNALSKTSPDSGFAITGSELRRVLATAATTQVPTGTCTDRS